MNDKLSWWEQWLQQPQRVEVARLPVSIALLDWRSGGCLPYPHEHHGKHHRVPGPVVSMEIRRVARETSHQPPRGIDRPVVEWHWGRLPYLLVPDRCDHLVAGPEVLASPSASQLARGLPADQLGLA